MSMNPFDLLRPSIHRALKGNRIDAMAGINGRIVGKTIILTAFFTKPPSEDEFEEFQCIGTEVIADYPEGYLIEEEWKTGWPETNEEAVWVENKPELK